MPTPTDPQRETIARLMTAATEVRGLFQLPDDHSAGYVGAALLTDRGNIYTGVNIDLACGLGHCAEVSAITEMLKRRETRIVMVVALSEEGILPPCGRCRETMAQINFDNLECQIVLGENRLMPLKKLLPEYWLVERDEFRQRNGGIDNDDKQHV